MHGIGGEKDRGAILRDPVRLALLDRTALLDTGPEAAFDRLTRLASRLLDVPVALVSLVDGERQFFKSCLGLPPDVTAARGTPLSHSFCQHVVTSGRPLIVNDARLDPLLHDNRAIPDLGVVAYLGIPLLLDGHVIGSFCAIDGRPRDWCDDDVALMADLTQSVLTEIRYRDEHETLLRERAIADDVRIKLSAALDAAHISTWRVDPAIDAVIPDANLAKLFGVGVRPGDNGPLDAFIRAIHPDDRDRVLGRLREAIATSGSAVKEFRVLADDGTTRWVESRGGPVLDAAGRLVAMAGVVVDNTERKLLEMARGESEARYRQLFDAIDEGFCVVEMVFDENGVPLDYVFLETNPAFGLQTGLADAVGRGMYEMVPAPEQHWREIDGRVARTGEAVRIENEARALGRWFDVYAFPVGGNRVAILFTDTTERKRNEAERDDLVARLRQEDVRKDRFLAMLAHELRNPLAAIGSGMNLSERLREPERLAEVKSLMRHQLDHLTRLVDDLLDTARVTQGKIELRRERVAISALVERAAALARPLIDERDHRLALDLPDEPVFLVADPVRVEQMLSNLLTNAAKYSDPGRDIALAVTIEADEVVFSVRDQGFGIEPAMLPAIFGLFTQLGEAFPHARGGLGLGLPLVRSLAELHGGSITAESTGRGQGSVFTLRLPLAGGIGS